MSQYNYLKIRHRHVIYMKKKEQEVIKPQNRINKQSLSTSMVDGWVGFSVAFVSACLSFFHMISKKSIQLGSPNLTQ